MPNPAVKKTAKPEQRKQVPQSAPERVEIRVGGRVRFSGDVYEPSFEVTDGAVKFSADRNPTMVDAPTPPPPTRFRDQSDPRDGDQVINRVHSGRRDIVVPEPEKAHKPEPDDVEPETEEL